MVGVDVQAVDLVHFGGVDGRFHREDSPLRVRAEVVVERERALGMRDDRDRLVQAPGVEHGP